MVDLCWASGPWIQPWPGLDHFITYQERKIRAATQRKIRAATQIAEQLQRNVEQIQMMDDTVTRRYNQIQCIYMDREGKTREVTVKNKLRNL